MYIYYLMKIKELILEGLRKITEGRNNFSTISDYLRTTFLISSLSKKFGQDPYFMGEDKGDFIAAAIVHTNGRISIKQVAKVAAADLKQNRVGIVRDEKDYLQFYIRAGRGIEHPDTYKVPPDYNAATRGMERVEFSNETRTVYLKEPIKGDDGEMITQVEIPAMKPGSPSSDAVIKTYLLYGSMIINFVEKNMINPIGYLDGKAGEMRNASDSKYKIQAIRKDAEDYIQKKGYPRIGFINAFDAFRKEFIDPLSTEELKSMDTNEVTKNFIKYYTNTLPGMNRLKTPISTPDAQDVMQRQQSAMDRRDAMLKRRRVASN